MDKKNPDKLISFGESSPLSKEEYDRFRQSFDPVTDLAMIFSRSREEMEQEIANATQIQPIDLDQFAKELQDLAATIREIGFTDDDQDKARQRSKADVKRKRQLQRGGNPHHIGRPE